MGIRRPADAEHDIDEQVGVLGHRDQRAHADIDANPRGMQSESGRRRSRRNIAQGLKRPAVVKGLRARPGGVLFL